jgi:hypothetical protein
MEVTGQVHVLTALTQGKCLTNPLDKGLEGLRTL